MIPLEFPAKTALAGIERKPLSCNVFLAYLPGMNEEFDRSKTMHEGAIPQC